MLFNSVGYAVFFALVFIIYWSVPNKYRYILLLVCSYYFYMSWNIKYVVLILLTTIVSYISALLMERYQFKKYILALNCLICLGVLFIFKYFNFFFESLNKLFSITGINRQPISLSLLLPVGISFFTFQTMSYVIDVYRGQIKAECNFCIYATFVSFFPQLVAGPIERPENLLPQFHSDKRFCYEKSVYGCRLIVWGLFKKIAVADIAARYVDSVYQSLDIYQGLPLILAVFLFSVQIYCDFSGYSDIARGSAALLGIDLIENFKSPYFSVSIKEYWRRWHISLSTWFRDYVYIPLGGSRCSGVKRSVNLLITFLASGLWHGANWTFFIWGGVHGLAQIIENMFLKRRKILNISKQLSVLKCIGVFVFVNITWIFFRAETLEDAVYVLKNLFCGMLKLQTVMDINIGLSMTEAFFLILNIMLVAVYDYLSVKKEGILLIGEKPLFIRVIFGYIIIADILYFALNGGGDNQFVYFQF